MQRHLSKHGPATLVVFLQFLPQHVRTRCTLYPPAWAKSREQSMMVMCCFNNGLCVIVTSWAISSSRSRLLRRTSVCCGRAVAVLSLTPGMAPPSPSFSTVSSNRLTSQRQCISTPVCCVMCACTSCDVWVGLGMVLLGLTFTSKVRFQEVLEAINAHAFEMSPFPVILSIENHCSLKFMQVGTITTRIWWNPVIMCCNHAVLMMWCCAHVDDGCNVQRGVWASDH
jgi:hypothetical protein